MNTLKRMPKSTNIRIDYLDRMTITSITANSFDSHSDAGSTAPTKATKLSRTDSVLDNTTTAEEILEVDEIWPSVHAPRSYNDLARYKRSRSWMLFTLEGFPYIAGVNATATISVDSSTVTSSPSASAHSTNSSIQTESKFSVRQRSNTPISVPASANPRQNVDADRSTIASSHGQARSAGSSSSSGSSLGKDTATSCGGRALLSGLRKTLSRPKTPRHRRSGLYPESAGQYAKIEPPVCAINTRSSDHRTTVPTPLRPLVVSAAASRLLSNESHLASIDHAWATLGMPAFFVWLLSEFKFVRPSPGAMTWLNRVELPDTSQFHWLHWEHHVRKLVEALREQDVWVDGDEFGDVAECVVETLETWLEKEQDGRAGR